MFVDEITISAKAGDGGSGVVRWRHEKGKEFSGPSGGDGGKGGDVYVRAVRDVLLLARYRHEHEFQAQNGEDGAKNSRHGKSGEDLIIDVPVGSIISGKKLREPVQLLQEGEMVRLLAGGAGGFGNEHYKGSTNRKPMESSPGKPGEEDVFFIELQLVVDVGLIGLPNAGKSSLLNALTNARAKVGAYPFTTLDPNLGALYGFVLADIPGLIEGASAGKGLGHKFLRHVGRTRMLLHCVSLEENDIIHAYQTVRGELGAYDKTLLERPEIVVLTKSDTVTEEEAAGAKKAIATCNSNVHVVSVYDDAALKALSDTLVSVLRRTETAASNDTEK